MISERDIAIVNSKMDVVEVISTFLTLKKRGANYIGVCPFHNEKTGSLTVSPAKQIYKCFGCGKQGNAITFVMEHEHYSYPESIKWIAAKYSIEIVETFKSDEERVKASKSESLYTINKFAQEFFIESLRNNPDAYKYLKDRGMSLGAIKEFGVGFGSKGGYELATKIYDSKHNLQVSYAAGLCKERSGKVYDTYQNRITFPFYNLSGKIIGFGGRVLVNSENSPKYINSPENAVFIKGNVLYGLFQAKSAISKQDEVILVEGYTDVISMHDNDIKNVVASSGTALTENQIKVIRRFTKKIVMLYDSDNAGLKAMTRGIDIAIAEGMNVTVCILPKDEDPDSFVRKNGKQAVIQYISENEKDIIDFYFQTHDTSTPASKDILLKSICKLIIKLGDDDHFKKQNYIEKVCRLFNISQQIVDKYLHSVQSSEKTNTTIVENIIEQEQKPEVPLIVAIELELMAILLKSGHLAYTDDLLVAQVIIDNIQSEPDEDYTPSHLVRSIVPKYREIMGTGEIPSIDVFIEDKDTAVAAYATEIAIEQESLSHNWGQALNESLMSYRQEVRMALGLYYIAHCKMQLEVLKKIEITDEWTIEMSCSADMQIKNKIRDTVRKLGLANIKF